MSSIFSIFCGTTFSSIFHFFKKQYQCLQELTKHYSNATVEEKFNEYKESVGKRNIRITTIPKKTEAGNPDFRVWDGKQHIVGYIEAKDPTISDLDRIEKSEQLRRYRNTFPNLNLTNFIEFRLYRNGTLVEKVLLGRYTL